MHDSTSPDFAQTALASGLLSRQQLAEAASGLRTAGAATHDGADQGQAERLADRLVQLGYLNEWQAQQLLEGHTKFKLGPYRIVDAIGKGGMGHVFKGEHELLGRIEAVKVLPRSKSSPESIARFQREIRVQAQLDHPNLVRVSYAGNEGDTFFFVTEYVPGTDLRRLVRRHGPLPAEVAAPIIAQAAQGLDYAHRKGLVHRDIKPGNLLVTPDGHTKLTDLGLAWCLMEGPGEENVSKQGTIVGTSDYLAPETIADPDRILPVSDIYALGCTLYYAVTAKVPFPAGKMADKMRRHLQSAPLNPLHFNPDLPAGFCEVIAQMMEKDCETRIPTAARVAELLAPWCPDDLPHRLAGVATRAAESPRREPTGTSSDSPALSDTAAFDVGDLEPSFANELDSASQISQPTEPFHTAEDDTESQFDRPPHRESATSRSICPTARRWIYAALGLGIVGTIVWIISRW